VEKIIVFGATGGTGKHVIEQALRKGHWVTAVVRNTTALAIQHERLEIVKGDVFQPHAFKSAITGKDVVISCLGIHKREPTTVYSEGVSNILRVMQEAGVQRIICLSAIAVVVPPKSSFMMKFVAKNILQKIFKHSYADMLIMEKILEAISKI
jgi:putative NADH-flavin reductase